MRIDVLENCALCGEHCEGQGTQSFQDRNICVDCWEELREIFDEEFDDNDL